MAKAAVPCEGSRVEYEFDGEAERRLEEFLSEIGEKLNNKTRRAAFATYALGLLGSAERKSVEPIAAREARDERDCEPHHHRLLRFLRDSPWEDGPVRQFAAQYALKAMTQSERIRTWVIDDTGFLKQGKHSVGVQRQYTGSAGKVTNCQVAVSLSVATGSAHVPIDFELYLPKRWLDDPAAREKARIPDSVEFRTKSDIALDLIQRAVRNGIPGDILLADSGYGDTHAFRETVRVLGFDYALGIHGETTMWRLDSRDRRRGEPRSARELARELPQKAFRRVTWRHGTAAGTRGSLSSRFAFCRVKVAIADGIEPAKHEAVWLISEWPVGEAEPSKFALTTLPRTMSKKRIIRTLKERYRTELAYEELKGELGLDHFEGRSFPGWNHHVTVALCCYAFVIGERMRRFPPSAGRRSPARSDVLAA